ncbi:carboxymuconolactone decarboxylase family protein [Phytohabitans sp. LJ34]|uniref:carboxymuconolactone decarboxylase family protein n=1 Tax=Phytohabitans sp. LJ34 TaxID=3452217 RepID=UPI003F89028D
MGAIMIHGTRRAGVEQVRYLTPIRLRAAQGLVARVYEQVERDFGMLAPPVSLHSPAPGPLAACWSMLRETLLAGGVADRAVKEVVATAVSLGNSCPYCVDVHGATLHGLSWGDDAAAIAADQIETIADPRVREVADWARASGTRETATRPVPFAAALGPELIGVAVVFQYINRMVNIFLSESPFPPGLPAVARGVVKRVFGRMLRPLARRVPEPGDSLDLLPAAPLPRDMSWAAGSSAIAQAFARSAAAITAAGERSVAAPVRELVTARLATWDGRPAGLSRAWVDDAVAGLATADRAAGRLALLAAFASYQVGPDDVEDFRRGHPADQALVELTSWAALAAARQVGTWLAVGLPAEPRPATGRPDSGARSK